MMRASAHRVYDNTVYPIGSVEHTQDGKWLAWVNSTGSVGTFDTRDQAEQYVKEYVRKEWDKKHGKETSN